MLQLAVVFTLVVHCHSGYTLVQVYDGSSGYRRAITCTLQRSPIPIAVISEPEYDTQWAAKLGARVIHLNTSNVPSRYKNRRHKLSLWSLPFDNVVFLDTDVFIVDGSINDLVTLHSRIPDMVLMSLDHSNGQNLNSGIMVFSPNVLDHEMMERCYTQPTLVPEYSDQEIITACFARVNRVLALGPLW